MELLGLFLLSWRGLNYSFSLDKEFAEPKKRWFVLFKNLELLSVIKINFVIVVLRIFQNILDEIISLFDFEDYVIIAVHHLIKFDSAEIFVLLTYHKLHDIFDSIDLLQDFRCALIQNIDNAFSNDDDDVGGCRVLLNYCKGQKLSSNVSNVSICICVFGAFSSWYVKSIGTILVFGSTCTAFCNKRINLLNKLNILGAEIKITLRQIERLVDRNAFFLSLEFQYIFVDVFDVDVVE